jgi:hypothetical protein
MKNSMLVPEKAFIPTSFQIAGAEENPMREKMHLGEMMLDAGRLEAVLRAIVRRKKSKRRTAHMSVRA